MANRDKQIERAREALEEKEQQARADAARRQPEGHDRPQDVPDRRTRSPDRRKKSAGE